VALKIAFNTRQSVHATPVVFVPTDTGVQGVEVPSSRRVSATPN
jgi:hypothetical protein